MEMCSELSHAGSSFGGFLKTIFRQFLLRQVDGGLSVPPRSSWVLWLQQHPSEGYTHPLHMCSRGSCSWLGVGSQPCTVLS